MNKLNLIAIFAIITVVFSLSACTTGKVNYKVNNQGQMVIEKTAKGEFAIRGSASDASSKAAEFEKNMTIKVMYQKYLTLIEKGDFENAKKLRIEIEVLQGKIASTPDTPIMTTPPAKITKKDPNEDPQTKMIRDARRKKK